MKRYVMPVGYANTVVTDRVVAIVSSEPAPVKDMVRKCADMGLVINATSGRASNSVVILDSNHVVLSAVLPKTLQRRLAKSLGQEIGLGVSQELDIEDEDEDSDVLIDEKTNDGSVELDQFGFKKET